MNLTEDFSVSGPLTENDIAQLSANGVTTLICTRPDGEEENQLTFTAVKKVASSFKMQAFHIPVKSGQYSPEDVQSFVEAMGTMSEKVHAYCRTGTRAAHLWVLSQQQIGKHDTKVLLGMLEKREIATAPLYKYVSD